MVYRKAPVARPKRKYVNRKKVYRGRYRPLVKKRAIGKRKFGQRKVFNDNGNELSTTKVVGGRKAKHNLAGAWKLLKASTQKNIYAVAFINRYMSSASGVPPGYILAGSQWSGASVGAGSFVYPLQLYTLSGAPNYNGTTPVNCSPAAVLTRSAAAGAMYFSTLSPAYTPIESTQTTAWGSSSFPGAADLWDSVSIKMQLYGCLTRPTQFRIALVQLLEPYLHPEYIGAVSTSSTNGLGATERDSTIAFYDELTRTDTYSGATFHNGQATKGKIKYLKQ